jgi:transcriptional regulator with XRE-family HTH domain
MAITNPPLRRSRRRPAAVSARATRQVRKLATELRTAQASLRISDRALADRAGVDRKTVRRLERGDASMQVSTLAALMAAAGLDLVLQAYEGATVSLRDSGQMEIAEAIRRMCSSAWRVVTEVAAGPYGRSADLVLFGVDELIHIEIERGGKDFQRQERSAKRKREALAANEARPVRLVLAVEYTRANRAALAPHAALIRSQYPARSREIAAALRSGRPLDRDGLLWIRRPPGKVAGGVP